ncbi:HAD family hydrolase [Mucilaginibacter sp.]|jgi:phosphoglycolate phosphatase|uniref:HAD family hydrolase n=1 Tax=Mucilaginibacter sp. TaxID=1882438 RepID=UPI002BE072C9|nr:HAD family hydrolase [Mucilaginibacter sp.]HTI57479.1 HAD family hydrolase [Mucilaginibacter sp.]
MNIHAIQTDGLIFDLDGTLWDASEACTVAWNLALTEAGVSSRVLTADNIRSYSGIKIDQLFEEHLTFIPKEKQGDVFTAFKQHEPALMRSRGGALFPGVRETLDELKKSYRLFIVSNCMAGYIEDFIEFCQLDGTFTDFESSGNTGMPKSENVKMIVERNGLKSPVYIGDTLWDQQAAIAAGVPFVWAEYGFGKADRPEYAINNFFELSSLIR